MFPVLNTNVHAVVQTHYSIDIMMYTQNHENCFCDTVKNGVSYETYDHYMRVVRHAQSQVQSDFDTGMPYVALPAQVGDLEVLEKVVQQYRNFQDVVIFGTGGSSLGAESLQQISQIIQRGVGGPKLHIITNIDPYTYKNRFKKMDFHKTGFIVISKSGATVETVMQFMTIVPILRKHMPESDFKKCVLFICQPGHSPLRKLAKKLCVPVLDHDPQLGGRYSVFSMVGVLPALLVGLSARDLRQGAYDVLQYTLNADVRDSLPAIGACIQMGLVQDNAISSSVLLAYSDRLGSLARWWRQLWAESLGKNGQGISPIYGMGPVDQHSQLQLWLDGPADKFFTVLNTEHDVLTDVIDDTFLDDMDMTYLQGRSLSDLMQASCFATYDTLVEHGCPTRMLTLKQVDAKSMGAVMMHYILETVFSAYILGVDPFNQPAVESGKVLTKQYLADMV